MPAPRHLHGGAFLIVAACAHADLANAPVRLLSPTGVRLERVPCSSGSELAAPVSVNGTVGWFILDSGTFAHAVYGAFAKRAGLAVGPATETIGGGAGIAVHTLADPTFEVLGVGRFTTREVLVIDEATTPLARDTCGVAGVIAPSFLATEDRAVVIDFRARTLDRIPIAEIDRTLDAVHGARFDVAAGAGYGFTADATIDHVATRLLVDTGACCTWVMAGGEVSRALAPRSKSGGKLGTLDGMRAYRGATAALAFGAVTRTLEVHVVDAGPGDSVDDGGIGSEALAGCVLVFTPHDLHGACGR